MGWMTGTTATILTMAAQSSPEGLAKNLAKMIKCLKEQESPENLKRYGETSKPIPAEDLIAIINAVAEMKKGNGHSLTIKDATRRHAESLMSWGLRCGAIRPNYLSEEDFNQFFNACTLAICRGKRLSKNSYEAILQTYRILYKDGQCNAIPRFSGGRSASKKDAAYFKEVKIYNKKRLVFHMKFIYSDNRIYSDHQWFTRYHTAEIRINKFSDDDRRFFTENPAPAR